MHRSLARSTTYDPAGAATAARGTTGPAGILAARGARTARGPSARERPHRGVAAALVDVSAGELADGRPADDLHRASLAIHRGELTMVAAPARTAGALLRVLTGALPPRSGSLHVDGLGLVRAGIPMRADQDLVVRVSAPTAVNAKLTSRQNLVVAARRAGFEVDPRRLDRLVELLDLVGPLGYLGLGADRGRRVRYAFARALLTSPALVVTPDVVASLPRADQAPALARLGRAARELDVAVVMTSTDTIRASFADRVVVLRGGRVTEEIHTPRGEHRGLPSPRRVEPLQLARIGARRSDRP